jgi:hypothetical protein
MHNIAMEFRDSSEIAILGPFRISGVLNADDLYAKCRQTQGVDRLNPATCLKLA